jgi:hypothetical protein
MVRKPNGTWVVKEVDPETVGRLAASHAPDPLATELGVDIVADPNREDDEGYVWTRLRRARDVRHVIPGSAVVIGSDLGRYVAKVISWDFEVSDEDPVVTLELVALPPEALAEALARSHIPAA